MIKYFDFLLILNMQNNIVILKNSINAFVIEYKNRYIIKFVEKSHEFYLEHEKYIYKQLKSNLPINLFNLHFSEMKNLSKEKIDKIKNEIKFKAIINLEDSNDFICLKKKSNSNQNLSDFIVKSKNSESLENVKFIIETIYNLLKYLKDQYGFIHFDLKPENIIISSCYDNSSEISPPCFCLNSENNDNCLHCKYKRYDITLIDFVSSSFNFEINPRTYYLHTIMYCEPEIFFGSNSNTFKRNFDSDIWSLSLIFLFVICNNIQGIFYDKCFKKFSNRLYKIFKAIYFDSPNQNLNLKFKFIPDIFWSIDINKRSEFSRDIFNLIKEMEEQYTNIQKIWIRNFLFFYFFQKELQNPFTENIIDYFKSLGIQTKFIESILKLPNLCYLPELEIFVDSLKIKCNFFRDFLIPLLKCSFGECFINYLKNSLSWIQSERIMNECFLINTRFIDRYITKK